MDRRRRKDREAEREAMWRVVGEVRARTSADDDVALKATFPALPPGYGPLLLAWHLLKAANPDDVPDLDIAKITVPAGRRTCTFSYRHQFTSGFAMAPDGTPPGLVLMKPVFLQWVTLDADVADDPDALRACASDPWSLRQAAQAHSDEPRLVSHDDPSTAAVEALAKPSRPGGWRLVRLEVAEGVQAVRLATSGPDARRALSDAMSNFRDVGLFEFPNDQRFGNRLIGEVVAAATCLGDPFRYLKSGYECGRCGIQVPTLNEDERPATCVRCSLVG